MTAATMLAGYEVGRFYDEMFSAPGKPRLHYQKLQNYVNTLSRQSLTERKRIADTAFLTQGISFTVYGQEEGTVIP